MEDKICFSFPLTSLSPKLGVLSSMSSVFNLAMMSSSTKQEDCSQLDPYDWRFLSVGPDQSSDTFDITYWNAHTTDTI